MRHLILIILLCRAGSVGAELVFSCSPTNDLYQLVSKVRPDAQRFDSPAQAIGQANDGDALLLLADDYPLKAVVGDAVFAGAREKHLHLYVEFPRSIPGLKFGEVHSTTWERAIIASDLFGAELPKLRIVAPQDCRFLPTDGGDVDLVIGRVAGFDAAVFGMPKQRWPLLVEMNQGQWLIATSKLSGFVTGRFAPAHDWQVIWQTLLKKLDPGHGPPVLKVEPVVNPAYSADARLPADAERTTFDRAAAFYHHARLLISPERREEVHERLAANVEEMDPPAADVEGDGSLGMMEGYASRIRFDGSQPQRTPIRADCNAEAAMVLSLDAMLHPEKSKSRTIGANLLDYVYGPEMQSLGRLDPRHPAFGLIAWGAISNNWKIANYGDDNARVMLATPLAGSAQQTDRWDEALLRGLLANLRTTGKLGFRGDRIDIAPLEARGWKAYHDAALFNPAPHFESYLWACDLWGYARTGDKEFLDKPRHALEMTMEAYAQKKWRWMDNNERSRMLLPLAWLVRVDDTPAHRQWLMTIASDLLAAQQPCGAIQERLGGTGGGHYQIPQSNEAYGTAETPLIQTVGDPATDQLYTTGFALMGLHEAAAATGDAKLKAAEDALAAFLCRVQVRSNRIPYIDGAWFRAFDYQRWDYWASSADMGWGVWSVEAGWGPAWTAAMLALRDRKTSLWQISAGSKIAMQMEKVKAEMEENDGGPERK